MRPAWSITELARIIDGVPRELRIRGFIGGYLADDLAAPRGVLRRCSRPVATACCRGRGACRARDAVDDARRDPSWRSHRGGRRPRHHSPVGRWWKDASPGEV